MAKDESNRLIANAAWRSAIVLPVAVVLSAILAFTNDVDWERSFALIFGTLAFVVTTWGWLTAPEGRGNGFYITLPDVTVPREAKLASLAAVGIVGTILLLAWLS